MAESQTRSGWESLALSLHQLNKGHSPAALWGLARSLLMYYTIPGRARGWRTLYRQFVSPGDLCFDIGAHVGNRTAALLAIGARVVALEPQPLFASVLHRFYGANPNFNLLAKAVGAKAGHQEILISSKAPTVSTLSREWSNRVVKTEGFAGVRWDQRLEIEAVTLDALIAQFGLPVFCKIDTEGYELEALRGLSQPIRTISFEYVPAAMEIALSGVDRLAELGDYRFNLIRSEYPNFDMADWVDSNSIENLLGAIRPDVRAGEVYARIESWP